MVIVSLEDVRHLFAQACVFKPVNGCRMTTGDARR